LLLACAARLQPMAKMGGGSEACLTRLALQLAQGKVGREAAALALLALFSLSLPAFWGVGGNACKGIGGNVGALAATSGRWDVIEVGC
jgi:hypothetical protein